MVNFKLAPRPDMHRAKNGKEYQIFLDRRLIEIRNQPVSPVHKNLQDFRLSHKLKKQEMAEFMGVTPRTYYAYEKGQRAVPSDALVGLATMTRADLNEILMGHSASTEFQTIQAALEDMNLIMKLLKTDHPEISGKIRYKIAHYVLTTDWGRVPRMHPESIRRAISRFTRYRDVPQDLPPPPFFEDYGKDQRQYEKDMKAWQTMVDENFDEPQ